MNLSIRRHRSGWFQAWLLAFALLLIFLTGCPAAASADPTGNGVLFPSPAHVYDSTSTSTIRAANTRTDAAGPKRSRARSPKSSTSSSGRFLATKGETELVQRVGSRAELEATEKTGLVRGGREGTHYVTNAANKDALRARQRLALSETPEIRMILEVPRGLFGPSRRVDPFGSLSGGGLERLGSGRIPARVVRTYPYRSR